MKNQSALLKEFTELGYLKSIKIIDTHTHMGDVYGTHLSVCEIDDIIRLMDQKNMDMIWCSCHSALFDSASKNGCTTEYMQKYPGRVKGFYAINPNYFDNDDFKVVKDNKGYIGFKFLPDYHRTPLSDPAYLKAAKYADDHGMVILTHTWGGSRYNSVTEVQKLVEKFPNIRLILGHAAPGECDKAIALAKEYKNVYIDICDIHRNNGVIERMVSGCGADKVLYGTDLPWYNPDYCTGSVLFADISDEDKKKIFSANALKILKEMRL